MTHRSFQLRTIKNIAASARGICAMAVFALISGCAAGPHPRDPFEPFNRDVSQFNQDVDRVFLRPVATTYQTVTPAPVRSSVRNFFVNITEPWSFANNLVQFKIQDAAETLMRFSINTVFGVFGFFDVAGDAGIDRHRQDFGQTLARYGVGTGPYLVLPVLGPSTVRDTITLPLVWKADLLPWVGDEGGRNALYVLRVVDTRANLLRAGAVLDQAALDPYSFQRDIFLQLRDNERSRAGKYDEDAGDLPPLPEPDKP